MVVVKIELIKSPYTFDSKPYKISRVYDDGVKHLMTTERLRRSAVRTAHRLSESANVSLTIYGARLQKTERKLIRRR